MIPTDDPDDDPPIATDDPRTALVGMLSKTTPPPRILDVTVTDDETEARVVYTFGGPVEGTSLDGDGPTKLCAAYCRTLMYDVPAVDLFTVVRRPPPELPLEPHLWRVKREWAERFIAEEWTSKEFLEQVETTKRS